MGQLSVRLKDCISGGALLAPTAACRCWTGCFLGENEATAFGLGDRIAKFFRCLNPKCDRFLSVGERRLLCCSVSGTAGQFWDFGYKCLILDTPVNDNFVPVHSVSIRSVLSFMVHLLTPNALVQRQRAGTGR